MGISGGKPFIAKRPRYFLGLFGVVRVTKLEPDYKNNLPYKTNAVNIIQLLDEYTEDYFNMKIILNTFKTIYKFYSDIF